VIARLRHLAFGRTATTLATLIAAACALGAPKKW
jgi:hypothetical protein